MSLDNVGALFSRGLLVKIFSTDVLEEDFPVYFLQDGDDDNNALTLAQPEVRAYWRPNESSRLRPGPCWLGFINGQKASDQQQHLFALLSLADPAITAQITPNYKVTLAEVFTNFARTMIENRGRISFSTTPFVVMTLELDTMVPK